MGNNEGSDFFAITPEMEKLAGLCVQNSTIDTDLYANMM